MIYKNIFSCLLLVLTSIVNAEETITQQNSSVSPVRGMLKPIHEATLSSEILATISTIPFTEGKRFKKGDILVKFDCTRYKAEQVAAEAQFTAKKKTSDNNEELASYNATARLDVEVSQAETAKARAEVNVAKAMVNGCEIRAPWGGRVEETIAHAHETVSPGKELLRILDDSTLEISLLVPSKWLTTLKTGKTFKFKVDETGQEYPAKVNEIGARVDPVSQTIRITANLINNNKNLLAGMSGSALFPQ